MAVPDQDMHLSDEQEWIVPIVERHRHPAGADAAQAVPGFCFGGRRVHGSARRDQQSADAGEVQQLRTHLPLGRLRLEVQHRLHAREGRRGPVREPYGPIGQMTPWREVEELLAHHLSVAFERGQDG